MLLQRRAVRPASGRANLQALWEQSSDDPEMEEEEEGNPMSMAEIPMEEED